MKRSYIVLDRTTLPKAQVRFTFKIVERAKVTC